MVFRKNDILCSTYIIAVIAYDLLFAFLMLVAELKTYILAFALGITALYNVVNVINIYQFGSKTIRIDASGIECCTRKIVKWTLTWDEIDSLQFSRRLRYPTVEIVPKCAPVVDFQRCENAPDYYFQLGKKAKKALEQFSPYPIPRKRIF